MKAISELRQLESLECGQAVAGDEGFSSLARCLSLKHLAAYSLNNLTGRGVAALSALPNLERLYLGGRKLDDKSLESLPGFQALREFSTGNNNNFTDEAFAHIAGVPHLENLTNMNCNATGDRATEHVVTAKKLKTYSIWGTEITDHSLKLLSGMNQLERLLLWNCPHVTDDGLKHLATHSNLRSLDLQECPQLTAEGVTNFPPAVQVNFQPNR